MKNHMEQNPHYSYNRGKRAVSVTKIAGFFLCLIGLGLVAFYFMREYNKQPENFQLPALMESLLGGKSRAFYAVGEVILTEERAAYADGDMYLYVPKLSLKAPVWNGVTQDVLMKGVGLLDEAILPVDMETNTNTSIMGNRDVHGMEFYSIDALLKGDKIYLIFKDQLYTYEVEGVSFTDAHDWNPLRTTEYPCVTLMAGHPIGVNTDRVFATGKLVEITPGSSFPIEQTSLPSSLGDLALSGAGSSPASAPGALAG